MQNDESCMVSIVVSWVEPFGFWVEFFDWWLPVVGFLWYVWQVCVEVVVVGSGCADALPAPMFGSVACVCVAVVAPPVVVWC
jgi:hypothetical protein